jgi:4-amino-4-deoxy-L-arabinose transferase-like glycosyltransferase
MFSQHGSEFIDYILGYHIFMRATEIIGDNSKPSGVFYYFSILMNNIPFAFMLGYFFVKDAVRGAFKLREVDWKRLFLWVWFMTGLIVLSVFVTKIDAYLMPFIAPACILLGIYFVDKKTFTALDMFFLMLLLVINLFWYLTVESRNELKEYFLSGGGAAIAGVCLVLLSVVLYFVSRRYYSRINFSKVFSYLVIVVFLGSNIYYMFNISLFEDGLKLSEIKKLTDESGREKIVYVSSMYHSNPQFSYYFEGIDLVWEGKYDFMLLDLKDGPDSVKNQLKDLEKGSYIIIVERDNINPGVYYDAGLFMQGDAGLVKKTHGYEMYLN